MALKDNCLLGCTACRILCYRVCCCCLIKRRPPKEAFTVLMLGLAGAGKTSVLSYLCQESLQNIESTNGFVIKDVVLPSVVMHVKEVGGSEKLRAYWHEYYGGVNGIIYVIDGFSTELKLRLAHKELVNALQHPSLAGLPILILLNKIDKNNTSRLDEISGMLDLPVLFAMDSPRSFFCDHTNLDDLNHIQNCFNKLSELMQDHKSSAKSDAT